jgi:hypothetical protein
MKEGRRGRKIKKGRTEKLIDKIFEGQYNE